MAEANNIEEILKPFYQRASEAQDRLAKLEASVAAKSNSDVEELKKTVNDLQSELKDVKAEQAAEREKAQKELQLLDSANARLLYRIKHLVRALEEKANCNSTSK